MPKLHLTKRSISALPPLAEGQVLYRDTLLPGFGLRVGTRSQVFFVEGQVRRKTVRVTIGKFGIITPEVARKKALKLLGEMAEGKDPNAERKARRASEITVSEAFADFFENRTLAQTSIVNYRRSIDVYLSGWAKKPISQISRRMVLDWHRKIGEQHGGVTANNVFRHFRSVYNFVSATHGELLPQPVAILTQARAWN